MTTGKCITKAVIPAAGVGIRFLPATKAMPQEMLPVVDRPAIQYVVEEAVKADLTDLPVVTGRSKRALEDHFDRAPVLARILELKGDNDKLEAIHYASGRGPIHYVRQGEAKGLGHAVLCAKQHVGEEPFAALLGDGLIDEAEVLLTTMMEVQQKTGGSVIALIEVGPSPISAYGCADITAIEDYVRGNSLVEKRAVGEAPSNLAVIGPVRAAPIRFRRPGKHRPGPRQRDPADGRAADTCCCGCRRRLRRVRRGVQGPPLRHWRQAELPQSRDHTRLRAC